MGRLLLVEDDPETRSSFARLFELAGHSVATAGDLATGLALARAETYDLIIADLNLGDGTALELLSRAPRTPASTPVIVMTGFGTVPSAVAAMKLGAVEYLEKPIDIDDLLARIARHLATPVDAPDATVAGSSAAERWADMVAQACRASADPRTLTQWAREVAVAPGTLRSWCRVVGVSAGASLWLARLLRGVIRANGAPWRATDWLNVREVRTLARALSLGGLPRLGPPVTVADLLARQRIVTVPTLLAALTAAADRERAARESTPSSGGRS